MLSDLDYAERHKYEPLMRMQPAPKPNFLDKARSAYWMAKRGITASEIAYWEHLMWRYLRWADEAGQLG